MDDTLQKKSFKYVLWSIFLFSIAAERNYLGTQKMEKKDDEENRFIDINVSIISGQAVFPPKEDRLTPHKHLTCIQTELWCSPKTSQNTGFIKNIFLFPLKPQHTTMGCMEANITDECLFSLLNFAIILISLPFDLRKVMRKENRVNQEVWGENHSFMILTCQRSERVCPFSLQAYNEQPIYANL